MTTEARVEPRLLGQEEFLTLDKGLPLNNRQRTALHQLSGERGKIQSSIEVSVDNFANRFGEITAPALLESQAAVRTAQQAVETHIQPPGVLYDITVNEVLPDPDFRPPLFWRVANKVLPIVVEGVRKVRSIRNKDQVEADSLEIKKSALRVARAHSRDQECHSIRELYAVSIEVDKEYDLLRRGEEGALAIYRSAAITSETALETFVSVVPWQAKGASKDYAERVVTDPDVTRRAEGFQCFVDFMFEKFHYPVTKPKYKVTSSDGWKDIESRGLKSCWEAFIEYRKLKQFADKGLILQPPIPDVIQRRGPELKF